MATYTEDFGTNANPLAGDWSTVSTNGVRADSGTGDGSNTGVNMSLLSALTFTDTQYAEIELVSPANFDDQGVGVRFNDTSGGNGYYTRTHVSNNALYLVRMDNGSPTTIGSTGSITFANGDTIACDASGTTIRSLRNAAEVDSVTDSTHSSGVPMVWYEFGNDNSPKMDNFTSEGWVDGSGSGLATRVTIEYNRAVSG